MATNLHLRQVTNSRYNLNSQFSRYRNLDDREGGREREKGGGGVAQVWVGGEEQLIISH